MGSKGDLDSNAARINKELHRAGLDADVLQENSQCNSVFTCEVDWIAEGAWFCVMGQQSVQD